MTHSSAPNEVGQYVGCVDPSNSNSYGPIGCLTCEQRTGSDYDGELICEANAGCEYEFGAESPEGCYCWTLTTDCPVGGSLFYLGLKTLSLGFLVVNFSYVANIYNLFLESSRRISGYGVQRRHCWKASKWADPFIEEIKFGSHSVRGIRNNTSFKVVIVQGVLAIKNALLTLQTASCIGNKSLQVIRETLIFTCDVTYLDTSLLMHKTLAHYPADSLAVALQGKRRLRLFGTQVHGGRTS